MAGRSGACCPEAGITRRRPPPVRPRAPLPAFRLPRFQWVGIEQPVMAVLDLQAAPSGKRPDGSRHSKRIGQSCRLTNLGRRLVEYLARLRCLGSYTQECIGSLKALFVQVVSPIGQANTDRRSSNASRVGLATPVPVGLLVTWGEGGPYAP